MSEDKFQWQRLQQEVKQPLTFSPYLVIVKRACMAAQMGGCNCTGACNEPVSIGDKIAALKLELALAEGSIKPSAPLIALKDQS